MKKKGWMYLSLACLVVSILSMFLGIISYTNVRGHHVSYNLLDFLFHPDSFTWHVSAEYTGNFFAFIDAGSEAVLIILLTMIGVTALVCSFIGLTQMSKQRPAKSAFLFALIGLITAIPALVILTILIMSQNFFMGTIGVGPYVIITPVAMVLSIITVSKKHNRTKKQMDARRRVEEYLRPAGDL